MPFATTSPGETGGDRNQMIEQTGYQTYSSLPRDSARTAGLRPATAQAARAADRLDALASKQLDATGGQNSTESKQFGFLDFIKTIIDVINPLQHIPVVSTLYRSLTGDEINPAARIIGDTLYGGPVGTAVALADVVVEETTGKDIGQTVMALATGDGQKKSDVRVAAATAYKVSDIVWNDAAPAAADTNRILASSTGDTPTHQPSRTGAGEWTRESRLMQQAPSQLPPDVSGKKRIADIATAATTNGTFTERTGGGVGTGAAQPVDPTRFLRTQEAPAGADRTFAPPEPIARKMLDAMDRYKAINLQAQKPALDRTF
jgi:hypothetical protein